MKDNYQIKNKMLVLVGGLASILLASCGSYQATTYDNDGIYNSDAPVVASNEAVVTENANAKYYEDYFGKSVTDYGQAEEEVFTDVDSYSSQGVVEHNTEVATESYSAWEDADDNVTINVYNTQPYYYSYWRPYNHWNNYYYNNWNYCAPSWAWSYNNFGYYGSPYNYYGYYGNSYYNNNYYGNSYYGNRNVGYANGRRRGYVSNSYYGRNANRNAVNFRTNRRSNRTASSRVAPRTSPRSTPRATPRSTPRSTPRYTPRSTPRATPRSAPRSTPRSAPRSTTRSSTSRRGRI